MTNTYRDTLIRPRATQHRSLHSNSSSAKDNTATPRNSLSQTRQGAGAMHENDFRESVLGKKYFRRKTGQMVSSIVAETKGLHAEFVRREHSSARSLWHLRQPSLALLWLRTGVKQFHVDIEG